MAPSGHSWHQHPSSLALDNTRPYNEYYLVAYLANLTSAAGSKGNLYFETYYATSGEPPGDGSHPVHKDYHGYELLASMQSNDTSSCT